MAFRQSGVFAPAVLMSASYLRLVTAKFSWTSVFIHPLTRIRPYIRRKLSSEKDVSIWKDVEPCKRPQAQGGEYLNMYEMLQDRIDGLYA